jgi:dTDP-4-amino-4,6-dideoxygalactose transaminase
MEAGFNARLETIQAAVARAVIPTLAENLSRRRANARAYDSALKRREILIKLPPGDRNEHAFHAYVIRAEQRDALQAYLAERGVESKIHYKTPLHLQPALRELGYRPGQFPVAEKQATEILSLPIHQFVREEQIAYVAESIHNFYGG